MDGVTDGDGDGDEDEDEDARREDEETIRYFYQFNTACGTTTAVLLNCNRFAKPFELCPVSSAQTSFR